MIAWLPSELSYVIGRGEKIRGHLTSKAPKQTSQINSHLSLIKSTQKPNFYTIIRSST